MFTGFLMLRFILLRCGCRGMFKYRIGHADFEENKAEITVLDSEQHGVVGDIQSEPKVEQAIFASVALRGVNWMEYVEAKGLRKGLRKGTCFDGE